MKTKLTWIVFLLVAALCWVSPASADGIIIPEPPICGPEPCPPLPCPGEFPCPPMPPIAQLVVKYHRVTVTIQDQLAVTHVDQVFYNPNDRQVEGTYMFPLPVDAAVTAFTLWVDGQPVEGKVLDAEEARQTYEDIVRTMKDPALLEYAGRGAVQARIFPIPSQGERRIELDYSQALAAENGLVRYIYPLNTEKFSAWPLEDVSVSVEIRSSTSPIRAVYSPSHPVSLSRENNFIVRAGYEEADVRPERDFALYYSLGEEQAFHLISYRDGFDPSDPDGYFLALLAPQPEAPALTLSKDIILVLDRSGSMEGEKFAQAQEALRYVLRHLNPEDRFNIIAFSTGIETYATDLRSADEANEALAWVDRLGAQGSTDIQRALLEAAAMADREKPTYLLFLTDGLPTVGVTNSQQILDDVGRDTPENVRLFAFGVGYDVDTFLLDSLAQAHHGRSTYVSPGEKLDEILSAFYAGISTPVLTDLELDFGDAGVYDIYPNPLPDLFAGSQIVVAGRYRQGGITTVTLRGQVNGQTQSFRFPETVFTTRNESNLSTIESPITRLWATRKIGYLLNQVRLNGADPETVNQIVRLSIRYGIVTPYTSYLVTEPLPLGATEQSRIAAEQYAEIQSAPAAPSSGQAAVEKAADQGALAAAEAAPQISQEADGVVKAVGARAFVLAEGVWVDTGYEPDEMKTIKVAFLSDDYFKLAEAQPDLAAAFALGSRVIALRGGVAYEVVDADQSTPAVEIPLIQADPTSVPLTEPTRVPGGASSSSRTLSSPTLCERASAIGYGVGGAGFIT